jgi:hypothetical protein
LRWGPGARTQAREVSRWSSDRRHVISRRRGGLRIAAGSKGLGKGPARDQVVLPGVVSCPSGRDAALRGGSGSSGGAARSRAGRILRPSGRRDRLAAWGRALRSSTFGQGSSSVSMEAQALTRVSSMTSSSELRDGPTAGGRALRSAADRQRRSRCFQGGLPAG